MIEAIENSAYATWVRESPSIFAYTTILSLHAIGLAIIVGINTLIALRLLGFVKEIPLAPLRKLFPWMYLGFAINAFSGGSLLAANLTTDLGNWLFLAKLGFIALAMINLELTRMWVFDRPNVAAAGELPQRSRSVAIGALVLWGLAMVAGRFTAYPNFVEAWLGF
jgi:energy-coupling factor transporter transmembrane protein EcfT